MRSQQPRHIGRFGNGDERDRAAVGQDARVPQHVVLELRGSGRWVHGYRDAASHQNAEKAVEVVCLAGQHDRDRFGRLQPCLLQACGDFQGAGFQLPIRKAFAFAFLHAELDMGSLGMLFDMPVEHVQKRCGLIRCGARPLQGHLPGLGVAHGDACGGGPLDST